MATVAAERCSHQTQRNAERNEREARVGVDIVQPLQPMRTRIAATAGRCAAQTPMAGAGAVAAVRRAAGDDTDAMWRRCVDADDEQQWFDVRKQKQRLLRLMQLCWFGAPHGDSVLRRVPWERRRWVRLPPRRLDCLWGLIGIGDLGVK